MQNYVTLTNSQLAELIGEHIHSERDRRLLYRRFVDGITYDELSAEFYLSRRQVARIIAKAKRIMTNEEPPERHKNGTPATLRGCLFFCTMKSERRCKNGLY